MKLTDKIIKGLACPATGINLLNLNELALKESQSGL